MLIEGALAIGSCSDATVKAGHYSTASGALEVGAMVGPPGLLQLNMGLDDAVSNRRDGGTGLDQGSKTAIDAVRPVKYRTRHILREPAQAILRSVGP